MTPYSTLLPPYNAQRPVLLEAGACDVPYSIYRYIQREREKERERESLSNANRIRRICFLGAFYRDLVQFDYVFFPFSVLHRCFYPLNVKERQKLQLKIQNET